VQYTVSQKNVQPLLCCNFDIREHILIFFGRNVAHKVSNEKTLYYTTSNNVCFCTTWQNGETHKSHYFTQMLYQCNARIHQSLLDFFSLFWLMTYTHAVVWLLKSCGQCVQLGAAGGHGLRDRKSREPQQLDCVACTMHSAPMRCAVFLKEKSHLWCVW